MDENQELVQVPQAPLPMSVSEVRNRIQLVRKIMQEIMVKDQDYGIIPGCPKPSLYQPGAEKLALAFHLGDSYETVHINLPDNHREYRSTCTISDINRD